jgi:hypothetical protein
MREENNMNSKAIEDSQRLVDLSYKIQREHLQKLVAAFWAISLCKDAKLKVQLNAEYDEIAAISDAHDEVIKVLKRHNHAMMDAKKAAKFTTNNKDKQKAAA